MSLLRAVRLRRRAIEFSVVGQFEKCRIRGGLLPAFPRRGGRDDQKNGAKPPLKGADGAVGYVRVALRLFEVTNRPVCAASEASQHFLDGAATPPWKGGE
jgi:hypothetical protein